MKTEGGGKESGVCFVEVDEVAEESQHTAAPSSMFLTPNYKRGKYISVFAVFVLVLFKDQIDLE